jgi:hypothetical protein
MACESSFWFWFVRPFAEFAGAVALILVIVLLVWLVSRGK